MTWIYLSPHFDDVALSCGGWLWQQAQAGEQVQVWTICAGKMPAPPYSAFARSLHERWQTGEAAQAIRREEDLHSCAQMGAAALHFTIPDAIYRTSSAQPGRHLYDADDTLFGSLHPDEALLVEQLAGELAQRLPPGARLVCPLALGSHVDHQLTRRAAERLGVRLWFYADYPYVLKHAPSLKDLWRQGWRGRSYPVSEAALQAWQAAVAAHASQISSFWGSLDEMRTAIRSYSEESGGVRLWFPPRG